MNTIGFDTGSCKLRPLYGDDAHALMLFVQYDYPGIIEHLNWFDDITSVRAARRAIRGYSRQAKQKKALYLGVFKGGLLIGMVIFYGWEGMHKAEIAYCLGERYRGRGIMARAVEAARVHAFEVLKLRRIGLVCRASNHKSAALAERLGFRREGTARNGEMDREGNLHDLLLFSYLETDLAHYEPPGTDWIESHGRNNRSEYTPG